MKRACQREASKGWFFGFKLHALRHIAGEVMNIILTLANWDDREPALALDEGADGDITIADLGYRSSDCTESLEEAERLLIPRAYAPERKDPALRSGKV
jgi:IS5 family transposase